MSANKTSMVNLTITSEGIGDKEKVSIQLSMPPFTSPKQMTEAQKLGLEFLNWFTAHRSRRSQHFPLPWGVQEKAEKRGGVIHRKFEAIKPN